MISLIWGQDENGLIGAGNRLPWHLPADMAWFRRQTMGKPVLMGRKTFESIGRPLPGRTNLILSRRELEIEGCRVVHSLPEALAWFDASGEPELMVMGGADVYAQFLPRADRLYQTLVHHVFDGDAWFPAFDRSQWQERYREDHEPDARNAYGCSFLIMERIGR